MLINLEILRLKPKAEVRWAKERKIKIAHFLPDYKNDDMVRKFGRDRWPKMAPLERNKRIAEACDCMIAFSVNHSSGTKHVTDYAKTIGKRVLVFHL